jgi:hypothetical protein
MSTTHVILSELVKPRRKNCIARSKYRIWAKPVWRTVGPEGKPDVEAMIRK